MNTIHIITDDTALTRKTLRLLDLHGLEYTTQPVTDPGAAQAMADMGYRHTPAVRIIRRGRPLTWNGFRPDLIARFLLRGRS
ncbi:hypothetical protein ACSYDW_07220 [Paeniglutamicibacter sp. R2-26]|uniref:hypothetical protein n=1 Tax=Paeniglutamicibacter sp. R2-26 TaxID=3144417 RepID=UPI003EE65EE6